MQSSSSECSRACLSSVCLCFSIFCGAAQGSTDKANQFIDWGQCENVAVRQGNSWWNTHTKSFAMRQISQYEDELGWAFWTYKLGVRHLVDHDSLVIPLRRLAQMCRRLA
eukprot:COSAG01_NODE_7764_length_3066_cov_3.174924_1_plen_110_part_00